MPTSITSNTPNTPFCQIKATSNQSFDLRSQQHQTLALDVILETRATLSVPHQCVRKIFCRMQFLMILIPMYLIKWSNFLGFLSRKTSPNGAEDKIDFNPRYSM